MDIQGQVAVVTGAGGGIGAAIARAFVARGAAGVVLADLDGERVAALAQELGPTAHAVPCDLSREAGVQALVAAATERFARVDTYVSNAGILGPAGGMEIPDDVWSRMWNIHVMAHVWAARAVLPGMCAAGEGYFLVTASAAGLLNIVESAAYGVTKHAAVALAEWLRISYGRQGIRVSCLCPQAVQTDMIAQAANSAGVDGVLAPEQVAHAVLETMRAESFLCLPHPEVLQYMQRKTQDYDRWLGGMQKMYARHTGTLPENNER